MICPLWTRGLDSLQAIYLPIHGWLIFDDKCSDPKVSLKSWQVPSRRSHFILQHVDANLDETDADDEDFAFNFQEALTPAMG